MVQVMSTGSADYTEVVRNCNGPCVVTQVERSLVKQLVLKPFATAMVLVVAGCWRMWKMGGIGTHGRRYREVLCVIQGQRHWQRGWTWCVRQRRGAGLLVVAWGCARACLGPVLPAALALSSSPVLGRRT